MPKHGDPLPIAQAVVENGGSITTADGTDIVSVSDNGTVTINGGGGVTEADLTGGTGIGTFLATNDTSEGVRIHCYHNSASPAITDGICGIRAIGNSDAGNPVLYGELGGYIADPTDGAEYGGLYWSLSEGGSSQTVMSMAINTGFQAVTMTVGTSANPGFGFFTQNNGSIAFQPDGTGNVDISSDLNVASEVSVTAGGAKAIGFGDSDVEIFFGSGAPTASAAKGSLYLRTDGSTTNDRMYVNTDGATTWTNVVTAA